MLNRRTVIAATCLLTVASAIVGGAKVPDTKAPDTKIQQLKKVFDASYNASFPERSNVFESKTYTVPLDEAMQSIHDYVNQNFPKFRQISAGLKGVAENLVSELNKASAQGSIMLTSSEWDSIKDTRLKSSLVSEVKTMVDQMRPTKSAEIALTGLFYHIIKKLEVAISKIQNDANAAHRLLQMRTFNEQQALQKGDKVININSDNQYRTDPLAKWIAIMDLIGLDGIVSKKNYDLALGKFGIIPTANIDTGLKFRGKGNVSNILKTIYTTLTEER